MNRQTLINLLLHQIETVEENIKNNDLKINQKTKGLKSREKGIFNEFEVYCSSGQGSLPSEHIGIAFLRGENRLKNFGIYPWLLYNYETKKIRISIGTAGAEWFDQYLPTRLNDIEKEDAYKIYCNMNYEEKIDFNDIESIITRIVDELEKIMIIFNKYFR